MNARLAPRRARSLGCFLVISLLLAVLPAWVPHLGAAQPSETDRQPAPLAPGSPEAYKTYSVQWDIDASGSRNDEGGGYRFSETRKIRIKGSATVKETSTGVVALPMKLKLTDESYLNMTSKCINDVETHSIVDPGRYDGGPDPYWTRRSVFRAVQGSDGAWTMANPFAYGEPFASRNYSYHYVTNFDDLCGSLDRSNTGTGDASQYSDVLTPLKDMPLTGDATGSVFSLDREFDAVLQSVHWAVKANIKVVVDNCKGVDGPVDISDPRVKMVDLELQDEDMTPDGQATLQAKVTCEGMPVINAPVELKMKVKQGSGGHLHISGNRPRGYIDTMEMKADSKFIGLTKEDGTVSFKIRAGRDLASKSRGIAGQYLIDARVRWEGLTTPTKQATFNARYAGFVRLPKDEQRYILFPTSAGTHSNEFYGRPATIAGVQAMADAWLEEQLAHDTILMADGMEPWPLFRPVVNSISLPGGGLFDVEAWLGPNFMWRPPYENHLAGTEVQFGPAPANLTSEQQVWYNRTLHEAGAESGTWGTDAGEHCTLTITGPPPHLQSGSPPAPPEGTGATPDVAASAALVNPQGRFVAGAGQTVTYAVGVENVISGTVASQVGLKAALPAGLTFVSADPAPTRMEDARTPAWDVGALPAHPVPKVFRVTARIDPSAAPGTLLIVTASATTGSTDANPANNQFNDWGLIVQKPGPDLVVGSDLSAVALTLTKPVTFTIRLSNDGNAPAPGSSLVLTVPPGVDLIKTVPPAAADPQGVRWNAGDLAAGSFVTVTASVGVAPDTIPQAGEPEYPLQFALTAASGSPDIDPASNAFQVDKRVEAPGPDLLVALHARGMPGAGVIEVGKEVSYTLAYGNFGNRPSSDANASVKLWPGLALLASQPAAATNEVDAATGVRTLTWNLGKLPVGAEGVIELRLRVDDVPKTGSIVQASVSSKDTDLDATDNAVLDTRYKAGAILVRHRTYLPVVSRP